MEIKGECSVGYIKKKKTLLLILTWSALVHCSIISANLTYSTPKDCEKKILSNNDISLVCHLKSLVASGAMATNFSVIQNDHTAALSIICDSAFLESTLAPKALSHLQFLKTLDLIHCKLKILPLDAFSGLNELRNLSIHTMNDYWEEFSLDLNQGVFKILNKLETLNLAHNKIQHIFHETICQLDSLKVINLSRNDLTSIITASNYSDISFDDQCLQNLIQCDVSHNKISVVNKNDLQSLKMLQILNFSHNYISKLHNEVFNNFADLQTVDFSNNRLGIIPSNLFQDSPNIRELFFQNNSISSIPLNLFNGLQQLVILNLSLNEIPSSSLQLKTFIDLIRLIVLDLSRNKLEYINNTAFVSQYSLQILILSHNKIDTIVENAFSSLNNLHTLDLSYNNLKYVNNFLLNGLYVLSNLKLSFNSIYSIHSDAFNNCTSIEILSLDGNKISSVPLALKSLKLLKTLNLDNNILDNFNSSSFEDFGQLSDLSLSLNQIENLTKETFRHMPPYLKSLDLSKNNILKLAVGIFDDVDTLIKIDLSDNLLDNINGLFMNLRNLIFLNVSRNKIKWFDYAVIPVQLENLDIHSNEIEILSNYYELEDKLKLQILDISFNYISEIDRISFPNKIAVLKINNNQISTVNPATFVSKTNLSYVNIADNNIRKLDIDTFRLKINTTVKSSPNFSISGNPFFCDCNMEWLQHLNKLDGTIKYPHITDWDQVVCELSFTRHTSFLLLSMSKPSDFLCKYSSHCFALCNCCDFDACDCEMVCPDQCTCYSDQTWNTNIVDCSMQNFSSTPLGIPMDVTDLYLDKNNISKLPSHVLIGRKNLRVIFLNDSNIHILNNRTFYGLLLLKTLHLGHNYIKSLHGYEFESLEQLEELDLSYNQITYIANITFQDLKSLTLLKLDHNLIKEFHVWSLKLNPRLSRIYLGHNDWNCDCQYLDTYYQWLQHITVIVKDIESIQCHYNESAGPYLIEFNVSSCSINSSISYLETILQTKYATIIVVTVLLILLLVSFIIACVYQRELKVCLYTRYGIRLFKWNTFPPERLFDAFVSYSKDDENFVLETLTPELECGAVSFRLCLRYRDLPMSEYVADAIVEAIESSHRTIIIYSKKFLETECCLFELKSAHCEALYNRKHKLIVILAENTSLKNVPPEVKTYFRGALVISWGDKRFWEKVKYHMPKRQIDSKVKYFHQSISNSNNIKVV